MKKADFLKQKELIKDVLAAMHTGLTEHEAKIEKAFRDICAEYIKKANKYFGDEMNESIDSWNFKMKKKPDFNRYIQEVHGWGMNTHKQYYKHPMFFMRWTDLRKTEEVEKKIFCEIANHLENLRGKLEQSLCKQTLKHELDIKTVETISINTSAQGFEGFFKLTEKDGTVKHMSTNSIYAGGYNIQCLHFRYLTNID